MKPSHTRLTCRAHNRFSPSIVLWQHFVGIDRPFLHHHRLSSTATATATEPAQDDASREDGVPSAQDASGLSEVEAEVAHEEGARPNTPKLVVKKMKTKKGTWHESTVQASIAKNVQNKIDTRTTSLTASEKLLATARAAFDSAQDYAGVVVQPMVSPIPCRESSLPWCLRKEAITMAGVDRWATTSPSTCSHTDGHT